MNFFNYCLRFRIFFLILKNERNITNFRCVFVTRFYITHKNFLSDITNRYSLNLFKYGIFINVKKIEKIHMESEKSINSFKRKKRIGYLIIY